MLYVKDPKSYFICFKPHKLCLKIIPTANNLPVREAITNTTEIESTCFGSTNIVVELEIF